MSFLGMLSLLRDYTSMATSRSVPQSDRYWLRVLGALNESQARVFVAQRALEEGRGGISRLAVLTGMSRPTIMKGIEELQKGIVLPRAEGGRIRRPGGGRKRVEETDPAVKRALARIVDETTGGGPRRYLKWT